MHIETERLIIDDIRCEDKEAYFINISHDKEVLKTFVCQYQEDIDTFDFDKYTNRSDIFAVRKKNSKELIGIFVECEVDEENHSLEIGYGLGTCYWGNGYATELVNGMIYYYFSQTKFTTVYASFFPENVSSKRVMEKSGMTYSHTNEKEFEYLGEERDLIYYKITEQ